MAGILLVIAACFFWGMDTLIRYPLVERGINPISIVFFEHTLLTLIFSLSLFSAFKRIGELKVGDVFSFIVIGGLGSAIGTVAFTESFQYLNPSLVIILQKLQPVVAILLARLVLGEEIHKPFIMLALLCMLGGVLVSAPDIQRFYHLMLTDYSKVTSDIALRGYGLAGVSIVCWGAATVFGKKLAMAGFDTKSILGGRFLTGWLVLIPFVQWGPSLILTDGMDYVRILVLVLVSGALAMWLYYKGMAKIPAKTTAIAEMFFPFFAIVVNWIFLGQQLNPIQLFGGGLLIVGSLIIQLKKY